MASVGSKTESTGSSVATTTKLTISAEHEAQRSQPAPLTPVLSARYALRPAHAALCLLMVLVFLVLSYSTLATSASARAPPERGRAGSRGWDGTVMDQPARRKP